MANQSTIRPGIRVNTYFDGSLLRNTRNLLLFDPDLASTTSNGATAITFQRTIHRKYDSLNRDEGFTLRLTPLTTSAIENETTYRYSATNGRFGAVTSNPIGAGYTTTHDFLYGYETDSNLHKTTQSFTNYNFSTNTGTAIHQATRTYFADRDALDVISNTNSSTNAVISGSDYAVNAIGQRTGITRSGSATPASASAAYTYNSRGELTAADEATNAMDRAYLYDGIGNREKSADSLTLPGTNNYTVNALNQYSQITNNSITTNPSHDDDGNATAYPLPVNPATNAALTFDGENRLIKVITGSTTVEYIYDALSRRVAKTVGSTRTYYIYDGWNCVAEYTGAVHTTGTAPALTRTYTHTWGLDLSGSQQGAGGVGGLLMSSQFTNNSVTNNFHPLYDGNGNITAYINNVCTVEASFDYDPFGNITNNNNTPALPYAFSTKPREAETGLYYYGYRYYDPITGRWLSRDPIEEEGGVNLYGFVENDTVGQWDVLGLEDFTSNCHCDVKFKFESNFSIAPYTDEQFQITMNAKVSAEKIINPFDPICSCGELRLIQFSQRYKLENNINKIPRFENANTWRGLITDPVTGWRVDWNDPKNIPMPGSIPPFLDTTDFMKNGIFDDKPVIRADNEGFRALTCAVMHDKEAGMITPIACLEWGFYVEKAGRPSTNKQPVFRKIEGTPKVHCGLPSEAQSAITHWNTKADNPNANYVFPKIPKISDRHDGVSIDSIRKLN